MNRLSTDMYAIDDSLPFILNIFLACIFGLLGILFVTCYSLPWFTITLVPLSIIYYSIQVIFKLIKFEKKLKLKLLIFIELLQMDFKGIKKIIEYIIITHIYSFL